MSKVKVIQEEYYYPTPSGPNDEEVQDIHKWIDSLKLGRPKPKRSLARDFSDGVLLVKLIKEYLPTLVDTKNYFNSSSLKNKLVNWNFLQFKVLGKLGLRIDERTVLDIADCRAGAIEKVLYHLRPLIARQVRLNLSHGRSMSAPVSPKKTFVVKKFSRSSMSKSKSKSTIKKFLGNPVPLTSSLLKPTVASENRRKSKSIGKKEEEVEAEARLLQHKDQRAKSIRTRTRPSLSDKRSKSKHKSAKPDSGKCNETKQTVVTTGDKAGLPSCLKGSLAAASFLDRQPKRVHFSRSLGVLSDHVLMCSATQTGQGTLGPGEFPLSRSRVVATSLLQHMEKDMKPEAEKKWFWWF